MCRSYICRLCSTYGAGIIDRGSSLATARCSFRSGGRALVTAPHIRYSSPPPLAKCRFWSNGFCHSLPNLAMAGRGRGGCILYAVAHSTACGHRMAHRKWEKNEATVAWPSCACLQLSFFPFPVGHPMSTGCTSTSL